MSEGFASVRQWPAMLAAVKRKRTGCLVVTLPSRAGHIDHWVTVPVALDGQYFAVEQLQALLAAYGKPPTVGLGWPKGADLFRRPRAHDASCDVAAGENPVGD